MSMDARECNIACLGSNKEKVTNILLAMDLEHKQPFLFNWEMINNENSQHILKINIDNKKAIYYIWNWRERSSSHPFKNNLDILLLCPNNTVELETLIKELEKPSEKTAYILFKPINTIIETFIATKNGMEVITTNDPQELADQLYDNHQHWPQHYQAWLTKQPAAPSSMNMFHPPARGEPSLKKVLVRQCTPRHNACCLVM